MSQTATASGIVFEPVGHRYTLDGVELPGVTRILEDARLSDFSAPWFTGTVMVRGTAVHAAIALWNEGDLDEETLDPTLVGYLDGWKRYIDESGATVDYFEEIVYDPLLVYAGTLDVVVHEPQDRQVYRTLLDIKPALYSSVGPQTAAYARCARTLYPKPVVFRRAALVLPGDGTYRRVPLTESTDERTFLAALTTFHWRTQHGLR